MLCYRIVPSMAFECGSRDCPCDVLLWLLQPPPTQLGSVVIPLCGVDSIEAAGREIRMGAPSLTEAWLASKTG